MDVVTLGAALSIMKKMPDTAASSAAAAEDAADRAEAAAEAAEGAIEVDDTLSVRGRAADAKAVGDKIGAIKEDLNAVQDAVGFYENYWNPSDVVTNHYYANGSSVENASNDYIIIPCKEGDTFYFGNNGESVTARFVNTLTSKLANLQTFENVSYFTVSGTSAKKIAITFNKSNTKAQINKGSLSPYAPYGKTTLEDSINQLSAKYDSIYKYVDVTDINPNGVYSGQVIGITFPNKPTTKSETYGSQIIAVRKGDVFRITGKGAISYRLWSFTDSLRTILTNAIASALVSDELIEAPSDGYLYFQPSFLQAYKIEKYCVNNERKQIVIKEIDGMDAFYQAFAKAYSDWNCDVYIRNGVYTMNNTLVEQILADNGAGIPIGHGCRYYFDPSARVVCDYTGTDTTVKNTFSPFDSQNVGGDYEIYGLHLTAKNIKYAIHDESNSSIESTKRKYKDCTIICDNTALGADGWNLSKCIGGGLGAYELVDIENCVFETTNLNPNYLGADVSYHDPANGTVADARIYIKDSYFKNSFRSASYNNITGQKPKIMITNCSFGLANSYGANHVVKAWNNEVR